MELFIKGISYFDKMYLSKGNAFLITKGDIHEKKKGSSNIWRKINRI